MVVLRATTEEVHGISVRSTHLDLLTAVIKSRAKLLRDVELRGLDGSLALRRLLRVCDADEVGLLW